MTDLGHKAQSTMRSSLLHIVCRQGGSAMIELSLILPIIIVMLLGTLDVGYFIQQSMIVADSAVRAAEYGAAKWDYANDTTNMQSFATVIGGGVPHYAAVASITCTCGPGGGAVSCTGSCAGSVSPAQYAQVTATATLPLLFGVSGLPATIPVKSVARIRVTWRDGQ